MPGLVAAAGLTGWSYGGSILTFAFPMLLFIFVAATLFVAFTKPHMVPGHRYQKASGGMPETGASAESGAPQTPTAAGGN